LQLLRSPAVDILGSRWLLFDLGGTVGIIGLIGTFVISAIANVRKLYKEEPLPRLCI
jgi:hypothetical protein